MRSSQFAPKAAGHPKPDLCVRPPSEAQRTALRTRKQYLVEVDLTTESLQPAETSINNKVPNSPSLANLTISSQSRREVAQPQIIRSPPKAEHIPKEYVDKLNRAIDDLHGFQSENARLMALVASTQQKNAQLESLLSRAQQKQLKQSMDRQGGHTAERYKSALQEKESQIRGYCSRIKLIEQKLQECEIERKANLILSNYYSALSSLFGAEEIEIQELRRLIEQAVVNSRRYEEMFNGLQHQQNEDLQRVIKDFNAATFQKNSLELQLLDLSEQRKKLVAAREVDANKLIRAGKDVKELRDALEALKSENTQLRHQTARVAQTNSNISSQQQETRILQQQLQTSQRNEDVLRREAMELRKVVDEYKTALSQTEAAHSRETEQMSSMLAEMRKNYYELNHQAQPILAFEEVQSLKQQLEHANKTIRSLRNEQQNQRLQAPHTSPFASPAKEEADTQMKDLAQSKADCARLIEENERMKRQLTNSRVAMEQLRARFQEAQQQHYKGTEQTAYGQFEQERAVRKQLEVELAIKTGQFQYVSGELEKYKSPKEQSRYSPELMVDELRSQLNQKNRAVQELQEQVQGLQEQVHRLQEQVQRLQSKCEATQKRTVQQDELVDRLRLQCMNLQSEAELQHREDKHQLTRYSEEMTDTLNRMRQMVQDKHSIETQLSDVKYASEEMRQLYDRKLAEKNKEVEELGLMLQRSEHSHKLAKGQLETLAEHLQQQLKESRLQTEALKSTLSHMAAEAHSFHTQNAQAQQTSLELQNLVLAKDSAVRASGNQLEQARKELLRKDDAVRNMETKYAEQRERLRFAEETIYQLQSVTKSTKSEHQHRLSEAEQAGKRLDYELANQKMTAAELLKQLESHKQHIRRLQGELNTAQHERALIHQNMIAAEAALRRFECELVDSRASLDLQSQQLESSRGCVKKLESQLAEVALAFQEQITEAQIRSRQLTVQNGQLNQKLTEAKISLDRQTAELSRDRSNAFTSQQNISSLQHSLDLSQIELKRVQAQYEEIAREHRRELQEKDRLLDLQFHDQGTEVSRLREQLRLQQHELELTMKKMESTREEHQCQLAASQVTVRELESRIAKLQAQLAAESSKAERLIRSTEQQSAALQGQYHLREELHQKLVSSEQKFTNLKVIYGQAEQAAIGYRSQLESLRVFAERREAQHEQEIRTLETRNSSKLSQLMERHTSLERKISELMSQSEVQHQRKTEQVYQRERQLKGKYEKELRDYEQRVRELRKELELISGKSEDKQRRLAEEYQKKELTHKEQLAKTTNQLLQSNQQERSAQQIRQKQFIEQHEHLQKELKQKLQQIDKANEDLMDLRQQMSLSSIEHESRVQELRQKLKVMQGRLEESRNEHSVRQQRQAGQFKSIKDEAYSLQGEKIALATKLHMASIRIEELESEVSHLKNEVENARHQQRLSLFEFGTPNRDTSRSSNIENSCNRSHVSHLDRSEEGDTLRPEMEQILKRVDAEIETGVLDQKVIEKNKYSFTKQAVYRTDAQLSPIGTMNPHVDFNYSKYYEENVKHIKSSLLDSRVQESREAIVTRTELKSEVEPKRYASIIKRTEETPKQSLTFGSALAIPKSPKMFPSELRNSAGRMKSQNRGDPLTLQQRVSINNAMSTQSLNIETEPSEHPLLSSAGSQDRLPK